MAFWKKVRVRIKKGFKFSALSNVTVECNKYELNGTFQNNILSL